MNLEYPYQLVTFFDKEPNIGEVVYGGENGWYPQIALKRRFKVVGLSEEETIQKIEQYCNDTQSFTIDTGDLVSTDRMPVKVIEVTPNEEVMGFHKGFISYMGEQLVSRYPDRDGANYYPHITAEYGGKMVIEPKLFTNKSFEIKHVYLLKDIDGEDSTAYKKFDLSTHK